MTEQKERRKLYHLLYADELRLDSLDAQLHGEVPTLKTLQESLTTTTSISGEGGIPGIGKAGGGAQNQEATLSAWQYAFRDARYFNILEEMGVDITEPKVSLDFEPDGKIYAFMGKLTIMSFAQSKPMIETLKVFVETLKKNPQLFGLSNNKETKNNMSATSTMADIALSIPAPPSMLLTLGDENRIFGPVVENAIRLPLVDQTMIFGSSLPFDWIVVGYLYPIEETSDVKADPSFLYTMVNALASMKDAILPKAQAAIVPLLILR